MIPSTAPSILVDPVAPAAGYIGGKRNAAGRIVPIVDHLLEDGYAEPFVGGGGIFLRRRRQARCEFINDISGDVANFFRVLQEHYPYLIDTLRWRLTSRCEFQRLLAQRPETLTDIRRAARFLYLQRLGFGGKVVGRTFGVSAGQSARFNITTLEPTLAAINERLAGVVIEQLPFGEFIRRYDRPGMLFYLDPPYWGHEDDYGAGVFKRSDFAMLATQLAGIRGRFVLSINDTVGVRETFGAFHMRELATTYSVGTATGGAKRVGELLVSNVELP